MAETAVSPKPSSEWKLEDSDSDVEALPNKKNFSSATKRWTLVHGVSRRSLKMILESQNKGPSAEDESGKAWMENWYSPPEGEKNAYETLLSSTEDHPDLANQAAKTEPFPSNGKGGFAKRHKPKPNKPEPCPEDLKFMFERLTPEQVDKLWNMFSAFFAIECLWVAAFPLVFYQFLPWKMAVGVWGSVWVYMMIQNLYFLHDCIHISPFPPKAWQKFITHTWADFTGVCWEDLVLEHSRHHAGTPDLLVHGEFGWDPAEMLYKLQDYSWLTVPLVPFFHFLGTNDTGITFMMYWYYYFPNDDAEEQCLRPAGQADVKRIHTRRLFHMLVSFVMWSSVYLMGRFFMDGHGWTLVFTVNFFSRLGWTLGWTAFANINHSHFWNNLLAEGADRKASWIDAVLTVVLGGRARVNEFKFHDLHHAFPNKVGSLSMRGRFNSADAVYDGGMRIIENGIFEHIAEANKKDLPSTEVSAITDAKGDDEPKINKLQRRRSQLYKEEKASGTLQSQRKSFVHRVAGGGDLAKPLLA
jgi:hypothetical protein